MAQLQQNGYKDIAGGEGTIDDPDLLMSVMEARELVEETGDAGKLKELQDENGQKQQLCIKVCSSAWRMI